MMSVTRRCAAVLLMLVAPFAPPASAQVKATIPANIKPAWTRGIQPISRESYYHAIECGKQGGDNPPCVFYDTGLCRNDEFTLSLYTPYKMVAYTVWQAVRQNLPAPTPNYGEAQRTKVVLGVRPLHRSQNALKSLDVNRGGRPVQPTSRVIDAGGGTFTYEFVAFAPTGTVTIDFVGQARTVTCTIDRATLGRMR